MMQLFSGVYSRFFHRIINRIIGNVASIDEFEANILAVSRTSQFFRSVSKPGTKKTFPIVTTIVSYLLHGFSLSL